MWRKKKFIIILLAAVLIVSASLGGIALAQGDEEGTQSDSLLSRVADILGIDQQTVEDAFQQARDEMREEAMDKYLQNLVDEGIISEEDAAEYKEWLESRPDTTEYNDQIKEWMKNMPDIPDMPRSRTFGMFRRMDGMRIFGELCLPSH